MLKNREFVINIVLQGIVLLAAIVLAVTLETMAIMIFFIAGIVLILCNVMFTRKRYDAIKDLTQYLNRYNTGRKR